MISIVIFFIITLIIAAWYANKWTLLADEKCMFAVFTTGRIDLSSWYRMWEATTALFSVCVRDGQGGVYRGIGTPLLLLLFRRCLACMKKERKQEGNESELLC